MNRDLFGTDGVRGLAGHYPLDDEGAYRIGMAIGTHFGQPGDRIVVASDPRESSAHLVTQITNGLMAVGVDVALIGVLPTPGLAYITREHQEFVAGVMVTASHNPYEYNGVKVFDKHGDKLPDATEAALNRLIVDGVPERSNGSVYEFKQLPDEYEDFLVATAEGLGLHGLKIAVDSANGAGSGLAERVFTRLGAQVTAVADRPDGRNINQDCGATHTENLKQLVVDQQLDLGVALDGDADRIMLIDQQGRELNGDHILYILAVSHGLKGVVMTVMSNLGVENALHEHGVAVQRVKVGDRYVLEGLKATSFHIGGEQSGHIIQSELLATGDALLAAVQTVRAVVTSDKTLAQWYDSLQLLPQVTVNIPLGDKTKLDSPEAQTYIAEQTKLLGEHGRLLIRPSGTEPLARIMVEAADAAVIADVIAARLKELVA